MRYTVFILTTWVLDICFFYEATKNIILYIFHYDVMLI